MRWVTAFCFSALALALTLLKGVAAFAAELPNVLIIMSDDHAAYVSGAYGNPKARTPNIDRLARNGVRFTNAFVNCPMCTPSRQSLITGRLPHSVGVTHLTTALGDDPVTLAEVFKQNGYTTAAYGKMHFNSARKHGFDELLDLKDHNQYLKNHPAKALPIDLEVLPVWKPFRDPARVWLNGMYVPYGAYDRDMAGTWFTEQADEFMERHQDDPFFLIVSFYEPHSPFRFPVEYRGSFDPDSFTVPEVGPQDDWQIPAIFRDLSKEDFQRITASYYTSTEYMDHNVGRVLDSLDRRGLSDDTLVIYLGDHGYNLGHHGRAEKHVHYEECVRAPLIVRDPRMDRSGVTVDGLVEFIDIFPTVTDYCGFDNPPDVEGRSLMPLLEGTTEDGRDFVFSEYYDNEEAMVRNARYKLIYSTGKRERQDGYATGRPLTGRYRLFYDVAHDPHETVNLADMPQMQPMINDFEVEMLRRFEASHPAAISIPAGLSREEQLDYFLTWREEGPESNP